jgi:hypothetical protein
MAGVIALPVWGTAGAQQAEAGHEHGARSAAVEAALAEAIAKVPPPDHRSAKLTRHPGVGKSGAGSSIEMTNPVGMTVVVVLDENGVAHSECVESAPPDVVAGASREPVQ